MYSFNTSYRNFIYGKKILKVLDNPPVKFFMHHSIILSMILAENKNWNFVMANYIQLNKSKNNEYLYDMYPRIGSAEKYGEYPLDNIIENHILSGDIMDIKSDNIIEKVINWIDKGYYVTINSDERMISNVSGNRGKNFRNHQGFYFGYDKINSKMKMLNFDSKMNYRIIDINFEDLKKSFESEDLIKSLYEKGYKSYLIQLRKIKQYVIDYNYTEEKTISYIRQYLHEYLNGIDSSSKNLLSYNTLNDNLWGVNVYNVLFDCLEGNYSNKFLYQAVCGLYEHKDLMLKRFDYLNKMGYEIDNKTIEKYKEIVEFFKTFKLIVFKSLLSEKMQLLNEYIEKIKIIINDEKNIVCKILLIIN